VKRSILFLSCISISASALSAQVAGSSNNTANPLRIAMLRWYQGSANGSTVALSTGAPTTMLFDGTELWVGGFSGLIELRPGDGTVIATFDIPNVCQMAYDGLNIWSVDCATGTLTKIRHGAIVATYPIATQLVGIAYDGDSLWVTNQAAAGTVSKVRAKDGALLGTFAVGAFPGSVAVDGSSIWVVNRASSNVTKLRASDGAVLGTFPTGGPNPQGIAFDGKDMWVTNILPPSGVTKMRVSDGNNERFSAISNNPVGIVFDGQAMWVSSDLRTYKLNLATGAVLASFGPNGVLVFDGDSIWVGGTDSLSRL
jgi:hypothetical protein